MLSGANSADREAITKTLRTLALSDGTERIRQTSALFSKAPWW